MPPPLPAPRPTRPTPRPDPAPARRARATLRTRLGAAGLLAGGYVALHLAWTAAGVGGPAQRQLVGDLLIVPLFGVLAAAAWLGRRAPRAASL